MARPAPPELPRLVLALPGAMPLAGALARALRCDCAPVELHRFPDGESLVRITQPVQGRRVVLAGSLDQPDGKTLPLLFTADAVRELGAAQVGLVAPYLAYMRQDKRFRAGEAVTSRSYARLLSGAVDWLVTVDPHLHRWPSLDAIYRIPTRVVPAAPAIAQWLAHHVQHPLLVGPDAESEQWVREVARLAGAPWTVMRKTRRGDRDVSVRLAHRGPWPGHVPVLLDDIVSTGHTIAAAAQALARAGLRDPWCVAVHALFDAQAGRTLRDAGVSQVISCDTVPHVSNGITLVPALARAVRAM